VPWVAHSNQGMAAPAASILFGETAPSANSSFGIAIHGGTGVRDQQEMTPELEREYRAVLDEALSKGYDILQRGGSSLDAIEAAIKVMEDSPLFNAGKGASFTIAGTNELDAAIMDGQTLKAGAVGIVKHIKNPISLARLVMEKSPHVLVVGEGAEMFAQEQGVKLVPRDYFYTDRKWQSLQERMRKNTPYGTKDKGEVNERPPQPQEADAGLFGTVGAVALDRPGNLAAGTSTGGRECKAPGRVGDSPINNQTCAVSSTGLGENILRLVATKDISDLMEYKGLSLREAVELVVLGKLVKIGGAGGMVAIDKHGNVVMLFTGDGMYRG
jgi:beta-aspartyl-peptidase (threonine type)